MFLISHWKFWGIVLLTILGISITDLALRGMQFLSEGVPRQGAYPWLRTSAIFLLALAIVLYSTRSSTARLPRNRNGGLSPWHFMPACIAIGIVLVSSICLALDPVLFDQATLEDGIVESLSFLMLVLASIVLMRSALRARFGDRKRYGMIAPAVVVIQAVLAVLFFVIAMEEISWGQRQAGFGTPEWFAVRNLQGEFNFHNFMTNQAETVYFMSAYALLFFLFLVREQLEPVLPNAQMGLLFPGSGTAIIGAMTTTMSWGMWNFLWVQICFFVAVLSLFLSGLGGSNEDRPRRGLMLAAAAALCFAQVINLVMGDRMVRNWGDTEIKEMLIALGLLAYSLEASRNVRLGINAG